MGIAQKLTKAMRKPGLAWEVGCSVLKGAWWRGWCRLFARRVRIGSRFRVTKRFVPRGPGRIVIGDDVLVHGGAHPVTVFTHAPEAEIRIGRNVFLNGTRFGASTRIEVGDDAILADCRIMDTDFHSIWPDRQSPDAIVEAAPVVIEPNVWVAAGAMVLKGVRIGRNSVVAAGAVVISDVPPDSVVAGNPARVVKDLRDRVADATR